MIRFLLTLKFVVLVPLMGFAQWESRVGLNFVPLIARSVEITSEFSNHPAYSLNFNAGYTFGTGRESFADYDVYDGVKGRKTSGAFAKAGGRVYLRSLKGQQPGTNFFIGTGLIFSQYKQTAFKEEVSADLDIDFNAVSSEGTTFAPALSLGFTHRITKNIHLDWGVQKAFPKRRNDFIGIMNRNYQPGIGNWQTSRFMHNLQGMLVLKYKL